MSCRWIILLYILKIHLKTIITQRHHHHHHHYYDDTLQQYDDDDDPDASEYSSSDYITRRRAKHQRIESEECYCTCASCFFREGPKPCCTEFCKYCHTDAIIPNQEQYVNQEQKVVFVPFPYPLIIPNQSENEVSTEKPQTTSKTTVQTTKKTSTTQPTTAKPAPAKPNNSKLRSKSVEVGMLSRHRQMKQINPAVKRSRPAWVPKYGIVPIPDHLAAKLMTQLTEVRALKAKRL